MSAPWSETIQEDAAVVVAACPEGHVHFIANGARATINIPMSPDQAIELAGLLIDAADKARVLTLPSPSAAAH